MEPLAVLLGFVCLGLGAYLPIRFFMLIGEVKSLEQRLAVLNKRITAPPANPVAAPVAVPSETAPVPSVASAPVAPPLLPLRALPPAAPVRVAVAQPDPLSERLRDLGLLPPTDLSGEYALGAWWAVRVGGVLAVAAVVFLGFWLNLNPRIPAIVRVMEVALVGAGLFWGGLRLSSKRKDLGEVLAASGLAVWQFAAWATYGLDKMRVCDSAAKAALVQFLVAVLIAVIALWRNTKLFGQLAVIFAIVAVWFSIGSGSAPGSTATGAGLVALLGVILMVRGPWGSAGVLGLIGSQVCLLLLYAAIPTNGANYLPLQLAALGSFLVLWIGERLVKDDTVLLGRDARSAFQLASFFAPACLSLFLATGGENDRATVSLLIVAVASIAGYLEIRRNALVSEVLLLTAVGFTGAGLAWLVDPHLVWLIWALAAGVTLIVGARTRSELVRWSSEVLTGVSVFAFIGHFPSNHWVALAGIAAFGLMLALREDWERVAGHQKFRRIQGILGVAIVVLTAQYHFNKEDTGWPWLVLLALAAVRFRPVLIWSAAPGYLATSLMVVFWSAFDGKNSSGWPLIWSALIVLINLVALWRLIGRQGDASKALRSALSFAVAIVVFASLHHLSGFLSSSSRSDAAWGLTFLWCAGGLFMVAATIMLRRLGVTPADLSLSALGSVLGFFIQAAISGSAGLQHLDLVHAPFILLGLGCLLQVLAVHTKGQGDWGTLQRSLSGVGLLVMVFIMLSNLPGAGVSLFWALASVLTFVIGHFLTTRSLRMLGVAGLVIATLRVLTHDITDMLGRIAACTALAVAFFGIAWLYGRITADKKDA
jgi:hypothetical protein